MKYWEIVADKLSAAGWLWGAIAAPSRAMAGVGSLTPVPKRIGLKSYIRLSGVSVKVPVDYVTRRFNASSAGLVVSSAARQRPVETHFNPSPQRSARPLLFIWGIPLTCILCFARAGPCYGGAISSVTSWPWIAVHAHLLPTGKVIYWPQFANGDNPTFGIHRQTRILHCTSGSKHILFRPCVSA